MLPAAIRQLADVAEEHQGLYKPEGSYFLLAVGEAEIQDGTAVKRFALEDVHGLRTAVATERESKESAERRLSSFGDLTPEKAQAAIETADRLGKLDPEKEAERLAEVKANAILETERGNHKAEIKLYTTEQKSLEDQLRDASVESEVRRACALHGGNVNQILPFVEKRTDMRRADDGKRLFEVHDESGQVLRDTSTGEVKPVRVFGFVESMMGDPDWKTAFTGRKVQGMETHDSPPTPTMPGEGPREIDKGDRLAVSKGLADLADGKAVLVEAEG